MRIGAAGRRVCAAVACGLLLGAGAVAPAGTPAIARAPAIAQWYLDRVGVPAAQRIARGDGVAIGLFTDAAAVDSGAIDDDPDLRGQFLPGATFADGKRVDGPPDTDPDGVSGRPSALLVSRGESGLIGVAPGAKIRPVAGEYFGGEQIRWLVDQGVRVIDYYRDSAFNPRYREDEAAALRYALARDVVVVVDQASAADGPTPTGLLVVGATGRDDRRVPDPRAQNGTSLPRLSVVAPHAQRSEPPPGWDSVFAFPEEPATAIVAGVAALVRSKYPDLNAASVIDRILRTAHDLGAPGRDGEYGFGLVDAAAALAPGVPAVRANPLGDPGPSARRAGTSRWTTPAVAGGILVVLAAAVGLYVLARRRRRIGAR